MKKIELIAIYGRVSSSNQENEGTIETQLFSVRNYAKENGFVIVKEYTDEGWSGDNLVRPGLDQLRIDAKKKQWDAVLIYDPDRLARRGAWQEVVMEELKELEIEVLFVTVPKPKTDEDVIMYKMRGVFSEYERMKTKERFRLGKVRKANEGHIIVSEAPYGYTFIPKNGKKTDADFHQGYYEINEIEAQVVRSIFKWVDEDGLTLRAIVRKLQELGTPPRKSKRGVWSTSTLSTLLRNRTYIGEGHYGASYAIVPVKPIKKDTYKKVKKTSRRMKPENEWIKISTPKIIEEDLFNRVGEKLKSNFLLSKRNTKNEYLLTGLIWCDCGQRRAGEGPQRGKHLYYRCTDRVKSFPLPPNCSIKGINARIADALLWKQIISILTSPELLLKKMEYCFEKHTQAKVVPDVNVSEITKEIVKLKDQEDRYVKAYGAGVIGVDKLKEHIAPIKEKIYLFENQINIAKQQEERDGTLVLPKLEEVKLFCQKVSRVLESNKLNFNAKKAIVINIVERIVGTPEKLQVYGYIPIESNINVFTINRNRWFTKRGQVHAF